MSEWNEKPISSLIEKEWPGEWGDEPQDSGTNIRVYRSTEIDNFGNLAESGGVLRSIPTPKVQQKALKPGDILLEASGGTPGRAVGRVALYTGKNNEPSLFSNFIRALRPNEESDGSFLRYALLRLHMSPEIWRYQQQTTGMSNLKVADYLRHRIPAPKSLITQHRIAEILSTVDEAIEQTEALIAKTQQIKAGLMQDLFTRGVWTQAELDRGDHKGLPAEASAKAGKLRPTRQQATHLYKESPLGWIPKEWECSKLGSLSEIVSGVTLNKNSESGSITVPYLRVANVQDGYLDLSEIKTVKVDQSQLSRYALQAGDVLMNEGGDFDKLGRGTIWNEEIRPCIHQNHVFRVRVTSQGLSPDFLAYWSQSDFGKKYFVLSSKQSTNLASINSSQLNNFPIAQPTSAEQQEIIAKIKATSGQLDELGSETEKLRSIKSGLMHDLLSGKTPVNSAS